MGHSQLDGIEVVHEYGDLIPPPKRTRRIHKKSRNGCLRCKQLHQKCSESKPRCALCEAKGVPCQYKEQFVPMIKKVDPQNDEAVAKSLDRPFCWQDLQALRHFLVLCPPVLPLGNHDTWTRHIPQLAHEHSCLMQAILSLGASHLFRLNRHQQTETFALQHRGNAIKGLKKLIARCSSWSVSDTDVAIATCYSLTFQTSHLPDAMPEYLTMVNGCALVTEHIRKHDLPTSFDVSLQRARWGLSEKLDTALEGCLYQDLIDGAIEAFDDLRSYVRDPAEMQFFSAVYGILKSFESAARNGIITGIDMYGLWYHLAGPHLKVFADPANSISKVVMAYFLSVQVIFRILLPWRWWQASVLTNPPKHAFWELLQWIDALEKTVSPDLQDRLDWPRAIVAQVPVALFACVDSVNVPILVHPTLKVEYLQAMDRSVHVVLGDILRVVAELCAWFETLVERSFDARNKEADHRLWTSDMSAQPKASPDVGNDSHYGMGSVGRVGSNDMEFAGMRDQVSRYFAGVERQQEPGWKDITVWA